MQVMHLWVQPPIDSEPIETAFMPTVEQEHELKHMFRLQDANSDGKLDTKVQYITTHCYILGVEAAVSHEFDRAGAASVLGWQPGIKCMTFQSQVRFELFAGSRFIIHPSFQAVSSECLIDSIRNHLTMNATGVPAVCHVRWLRPRGG